MDAPGRRETLVERLRQLLATRDAVREVRMFGGLAFMIEDQMAVSAGATGDLLVRVDPLRYDELLERGATPATMGAERPMGRGWISLPGSRLKADTELAFWLEVGIDSRNARC